MNLYNSREQYSIRQLSRDCYQHLRSGKKYRSHGVYPRLLSPLLLPFVPFRRSWTTLDPPPRASQPQPRYCTALSRPRMIRWGGGGGEGWWWGGGGEQKGRKRRKGKKEATPCFLHLSNNTGRVCVIESPLRASPEDKTFSETGRMGSFLYLWRRITRRREILLSFFSSRSQVSRVKAENAGGWRSLDLRVKE